MAITDKLDKGKAPATFVTASNLKVEGQVFLVPGIKLFDEMNVLHRKFIAVSDVSVLALGADSQTATAKDILFLNKDEILCTVLQEGEANIRERKRVHVILAAINDSSIEGEIFVPSEIRLLDALNLSDAKFLVLAGAKISPLHPSSSGENVLFEAPWLMVNKRFIVSAAPVEKHAEPRVSEKPAGSPEADAVNAKADSEETGLKK